MAHNAAAFEADDGMNRQPGAYTFLEREGKRVGIVHACPCGCGRRTSLLFRGLGCDGHPEWDVKGEWPKVTLAPSIGIGRGQGPNGSYHWHGFLEDGVFVER